MLPGLKFLAFACFIASVSANPVYRSLVLHEQREDVPAGFVNTGAAPADQVLSLRVALVNSDMAGLEKALYDVSTPDSSLYGQHLAKEDVEEFVKPAPESVTMVNEFFASYNITAKSISPAGDWLAFSVPVSLANEMFDANFSVFQHEKTGKQFVRTLAYSIPADLQGHLDLVHPTITFESPSARLPLISSPLPAITTSTPTLSTRQSVPSSCDSIVTPACLEALYAIPTTLATESSNVLGVSGFALEYASQADLADFLKYLRTDMSDNTTFSLQTLDGGQNPQTVGWAGLEANLDTQYTVGIASGVPTTFISVGESTQDGALDGLLDIINFLLNESNPPHVLTTSYGLNENEMSSALASQLCSAYMQLGARGTSILFASGDGGVAGFSDETCTTFLPTFPSGCPFMTSVGATTGIEETAWTSTSGGFSNYFDIPSYQADAVSSYLTTLGSTNSGLFNRTGRAFPDVSAQGGNFEVVLNEAAWLVSGTSCASPVFASVVALLNDRLIAAGKSPLGFLNPFLYSAAGQAALNDITSGDNAGCSTNGFSAAAGWDPVTGLGTPNFPNLLSAVGL
ncbi:family S53 protease-like protein [Phellopilus nigrolimitatus]|nr:family S53 protease-like protein [Phellopilus nigrolimitatus]